MTDTASTEAFEKVETPFTMCIDAIRMARHNASVWRKMGDLTASRKAFERARWYLSLARRRRDWR